MIHIKSAGACEKPVPLQHAGSQHTTVHTVTCATVDACIQRYNIAKEKLLEVNRWHQFSGSLSANFTLTDSDGHVLDHKAQEGDHIRVDLPGPGSRTGKGYDWVKIEKIEDRSTPSGNCAYIAIRVRPSGNPYHHTDGKPAHFYDEEATSSFVIERVGTSLRACVYGRNEMPNSHPDNILDKVRNWLIALPAAAGLAKPQWKSLVKGLLK
ncbi:MAG TPA: hypothetical protein VFS25_13920 [Chitinophaga sp.]|uniref:hypothetical protein n=1 Tax=Chitinophaga sp. TaxID=1869181 RepID=UPI002DB771E4|nr:hypothetical protein [Chitinophaga sp.]HEU4553934.1 hypothetical protein [Chitinophaga sp.]